MYYNSLRDHPNLTCKNPPGGQRHFAFGFYNKQKILGYNKDKTHPRFTWTSRRGVFVSSIHAEMDLLLKVPKANYKVLKVFVTRLNLINNEIVAGNSKPCKYCYKFLLEAGVKLKNIYYTDSNANWRCLKDYHKEYNEEYKKPIF